MKDDPLSKEDMKELIKKGFTDLSIQVPETQIDQCCTYINTVEQWNKRINLVKAGGETLVVKHLFDSLAGLPLFLRTHPRAQVYDIGSGAGFPGIPLSICMPDSDFILSERVGKKAIFLQNAILSVKLKNVTVFGNNFKDMDKKVDIITFRAFSAIGPVLEDLLRLLNPGGCIIAYKGQRSKIDEELKEIPNTIHKTSLHIEIKTIHVPFLDNERHMVIIKQ